MHTRITVPISPATHRACLTAIAAIFALLATAFPLRLQATESELDIALGLADQLRAARTVVARHQDLINAPTTDKALTSDRLLDEMHTLLATTGKPVPGQLPADSRLDRYLSLQAEAIVEIIDESQPLINRGDVGFKGFVPAVFARLANERFGNKALNDPDIDAEIKVTAPMALIRNRKSRPDDWEHDVIEQRFQQPGWRRGELFAEPAMADGRQAYRVMVPEYYGDACLGCHGGSPQDVDITGYPKEGADLDELGGAISVTIFE